MPNKPSLHQLQSSLLKASMLVFLVFYALLGFGQLNGIYTIEKGGFGNRNYTSFAAAVDDLEKYGVSGPVTFIATKGTYNERLVLPHIVGAGPLSRITFDGLHRDSCSIVHTGSSLADASTVELDSTDYVTISNMTLISGSTAYAQTIRVSNHSDFNEFSHCKIAVKNSLSDKSCGITISGKDGTNIGTYARGNRFIDNIVTGHYSGISVIGKSGTWGDVINNKFEKNTISNYYAYGIFNYQSDSSLFEGNFIEQPRSPDAVGYFGSNANCVRFVENRVTGYGLSGIHINQANSGYVNKSSAFVNNMVSGESKMVSPVLASAGIHLGKGSRNVKIWHNSILHRAVRRPKKTSRVLSKSTALRIYGAIDADIRNNILSNTSTTSRAFAFADSSSTYTNVDHNNYYVAKTGAVAYDGLAIRTLKLWKRIRPDWNHSSTIDKPPFLSNTDLHLYADKPFARGTLLDVDSDIDGNSRCNLAPTVGADESNYQGMSNVAFSMDDTVFLQSPIEAINGSPNQESKEFRWFVDGAFKTKSAHLAHTFATYGSHSITLKSTGCDGKDSFEKNIWVDSPKVKPIVEFIADKNRLITQETVKLRDLSQQGPSNFYWKMEPYWFFDHVRSIYMRTYDFVNGTDSTSKNPEVVFLTPGLYDVCLSTSNLKGSSSLCKREYLEIGDAANLCDVFSSNALSGKLYDAGGPLGPYKSGNTCQFTINPCAREITLIFRYLSLGADDHLRIFEGTDSTGKLLTNYHSQYQNGLTGQSTVGHFMDTLKVSGNAVYIEFESRGEGGLGFELDWFSARAAGKKPIANILAPDSVCAQVNFAPQNISSGVGNQYFWSMGEKGNIDFTDSAIVYQYKASGNYWIKLRAENCFGYSEDSHQVTVMLPSKAPSPDFSFDISKPKPDQKVRFMDLSTMDGFDCANEWHWSFTPSSVVFVDQTDEYSQHPIVVFRDTGCYSVKLVVGNSFGKDSMEVSCAVDVLDLCDPRVSFLNTDIGISRVALEDIDRTSKMADKAYNDYTSTDRTTLELGKTYYVLVGRSGSRLNDINRSIWIDYDQDGKFNDTTENVAVSGPDKLPFMIHKFTVPKTVQTGWATLRVGVNIANKSNEPCGPNQFGEFEDYLVKIVPDEVPPTVYLIIDGDTTVGNKSITVEKCSSWSSPTAFGVDANEGHISSYVLSGSVDTKETGEYTLLYEIKDQSGNTGSATVSVNVLADTTEPIIQLYGALHDTVDVFGEYIEPGYTLADNCDDQPQLTIDSDLDLAKIGNYTIEYTLIDGDKNKARAYRYITVVDLEAPSFISMNGSDTIRMQVFEPYLELGVVFVDNYDKVENLDLRVDGFVNTSVLGEYQLKYSAVDRSGNTSATISRVVYVGDSIKPKVQLIGLSEVDLSVMQKYYDIGITWSDNYSTQSGITIKRSGSFVDNFGEEGTVDQLGRFEYTYEVIDEAGNSGFATRIINVDDRVAPQLKLLGPLIMEVPRWEGFDDPGYELSDNYWDAENISVNTSSNLDLHSLGSYYIQYCPVDASGNEGICHSRTVFVVDRQTGLNEMQGLEFSLFPNPANQYVLLSSEMAEPQDYTVTIYSSVGHAPIEVVHGYGSFVKEEINLGGLASGIYLVKLQTNSGFSVKTLKVHH